MGSFVEKYFGKYRGTGRSISLSALLLALVAVFSSATSAEERVVADTRYGQVRGTLLDDISVFKGVRYGKNTAETRFKAPHPPAPWQGVADALEFGAQCPQIARAAGGGLFESWVNRTPDSEDCLFLNVWTPGLADDKKRPVMVWFHGGGFVSGSGASHGYDGTRLARRGDVVVITLNHRLNVFGHLSLAGASDSFAESGNAGVLDLKLALEWVRDNAAAFGGDPDNVMIFGESGGGAKVTTLMSMPAAKGLFHRAAVQSGAWLTFIQPEKANDLGKAVLAELGEDALSRIDQFSTAEIQAAVASVLDQRGGPAAALASWGPVFDGQTLNHNAFTPEAPPSSSEVPLLIGLNRTESSLFIGSASDRVFNMGWEHLPMVMGMQMKGVDIPGVIANYRKLHPDYTPADVLFAATTDGRWLRSHVAQAERKAAQKGAPAYFYMLNWDTPVDGGKWRSPHALEIGLVFDNVKKSVSMNGDGPEAQRLADLMSEAWIAFARTGNPGNALLPEWPAYNADTRPAMVFDVEPSVVNDVRGEERRWFDGQAMWPAP